MNSENEDTQREKITRKVDDDTELQMMPYHDLKDIKRRSHREKDNWDIARLEELRNLKK